VTDLDAAVTDRDAGSRIDRPWYAVDGRSETAVAIIAALEGSGRANQGMQRRLHTVSGLGETDTTAVVLLLTASASGELVTPKDLAARLQLSTAAASGLVDRLVRAGYVRREAHPTDRRGVTVVLTDEGRERADRTIGAVYGRLLDLAESLPPEDAATVLRFLERMTDEVSRMP
jgi:DNA-binding MarR family transcriptional regulator